MIGVVRRLSPLISRDVAGLIIAKLDHWARFALCVAYGMSDVVPEMVLCATAGLSVEVCTWVEQRVDLSPEFMRCVVRCGNIDVLRWAIGMGYRVPRVNNILTKHVTWEMINLIGWPATMLLPTKHTEIYIQCVSQGRFNVLIFKHPMIEQIYDAVPIWVKLRMINMARKHGIDFHIDDESELFHRTDDIRRSVIETNIPLWFAKQHYDRTNHTDLFNYIEWTPEAIAWIRSITNRGYTMLDDPVRIHEFKDLIPTGRMHVTSAVMDCSPEDIIELREHIRADQDLSHPNLQYLNKAPHVTKERRRHLCKYQPPKVFELCGLRCNNVNLYLAIAGGNVELVDYIIKHHTIPHKLCMRKCWTYVRHGRMVRYMHKHTQVRPLIILAWAIKTCAAREFRRLGIEIDHRGGMSANVEKWYVMHKK